MRFKYPFSNSKIYLSFMFYTMYQLDDIDSLSSSKNKRGLVIYTPKRV